MIKNILPNLAGIFGKLLIDLLFFTTQIELKGKKKVESIILSKRFILAFWHSRILLVSYLYKGWNGAAIVSRSSDGEIIARVLQRQGHETIRGSTSGGGLRALATQIRRLNEKNMPGAVIPDGPRGPRFKVQPGVITLAKKTGYHIIPITYSAKKIKLFKSWDRFILPFPFTKCLVVYGNPLYVPADADKNRESVCRLLLEKELCRITFEADRYYCHRIT